ncbi:carboxylesterase family protein [Nocardia brasiliensis]|uniref:Carboxylic ester hydrolase n=1 Tax=Nocardia brasiliensis TaxID=37326 RepID=A0A6G9XSR2_NOCBR|nr:carboxylesterase family protein [Nocardia brasiliensis]QIS03964.1 carboxylesterase family protein [Nocardia brasiliensis]
MRDRPEVRTASGVVRGEWTGGVAVFRGIPYARPPVGARRFAAPVPALSWDGVREAAEFGPSVPQAGCAGADSGDCLTLNVWSPDLGPARLPVLVWIHGGAYREGGSSNPHHDGTLLAAAGAVMVTLNYRTGFEGFAHITGAPDNRGILDQAAALRWVQDQVAVFGGDPGTVTVFGQSAGAGSVAALLAMPMAAGLFRRAIAQSVPGTYFTPDLAAAVSASIAAEVGVRADVDELTRITPRALVDATDAMVRRMPEFVDSWGPMALTPTPFSPVVDGDVLPDTPWRALAHGTAHDIDLLVGHTRDEYRLFNTRRGDTVSDAELATTFGRLAPGIDYRTAFPGATNAELYETVNADWLFRMPSVRLADAHSVGGGRTRLYELCWSFRQDQGASHSLDVLLVFGTLGVTEVRAHPRAHPDAAEELTAVGDAMRADWLAFATTGDPGWAPYDSRSRTTRVYTGVPETQPYPEEPSRRIWALHPFAPLDLRSS